MKRVYSLLLIFLLMFSSVFPAVPSVAAATEDDTVYADGEYDLPFVVWQADKDEISVADGYLEKPAKVIIEDGEYTVQATLKNDSWWQYFKVESGGDFIDVDVLSEDKEADTSLVQFKVDDLDEILNSKIHVIVEFINYDNKYDIRFNFDTSDLPLAEDTDLEEEPTEPEEEEAEDPEEPEQPEEPEESDEPEEGAEEGNDNPEEDPVNPEQPDEDSEETPGDSEENAEQPEALEIADGDYTIGFEALHAEEDKASGMARYINPTADLSVKDGKTYLTVTLTDHKTVTGFQVDSNGELVEPTEEKVNEEANTRAVTYELDELLSIIDARVQYKVGTHEGDQPLRLAFNHNSLQEKESDNSDATYQNGEYELPFEVWQADKDDISVADDYLEKPATLTVEDGKYTVEATLKNSSWWQYFKVASGDDFIDVTEVGKDEAKDTKVVQFEVDDIDAILDAKVHIIVTGIPGFVYDNKYDIRFNFDTDNMTLLDDESGEDDEEEGNDSSDKTVKTGETVDVNANTTVQIEDSKIAVQTPADLPEGTKITIEVMDENSTITEGFELAGSIVDVTVDFQDDTKVNAENFILTLPYDADTYEKDEVDIYYYNETASTWEKRNGTVDSENGTINVEVAHFSQYAVLAVADELDEDPTDPNEDSDEPSEDPANPDEDSDESGDDSENNNSDAIYKNGEYELPFEVWQADKDDISVADGYLEKPATLTVEDGKYTVEATLKNSSWWQYFKIASGDDFIDVTEVSKDEAKDTKVVQFEVDDIDAILDAKVHIIVTGIPGLDYDNKYDIRFNFDTSDLPLNENTNPEEEPTEPEDPEDPEDPEEPGETPEDPEEDTNDPETDPKEDPKEDTEDPEKNNDADAIYKNGEYELPFEVWQANKDEISVADGYLEKPAKLIVEDGKYTVQTTLKNSSWWQYFKVASGDDFIDVTEVSKNDTADTKVVQFEVDDIDAILDAKVHIIVTGIPGLDYDNKYDIRFNFDTSEIPLNEGKERPDPTPTPVPNPNPSKPTPKPGSDPGKGSDKNSEKICEDGEYDLPFEVLHADKDQVSVADEYFEKPAKLIVKDGKFTVETTLKNSSWWQSFQVASNDGFVDVTEVSKNNAEDTSVVQFNVQNVHEILNGKVHIIVTGIPGFEYDNKYDIRFNFDPSDIPLDNCHLGKNGTNDNDDEDENNGKQIVDNNGDDLDFDRDADGSLSKNDDQQNNNLNPKTADVSKIILFTLLLVGSMIPLIIKFRQRLSSH